MAKLFGCKNRGCNGEIDGNNFFFPPVRGCTISQICYPCPVCGLIYWPDGEPRSFVEGFLAVLKKDEEGRTAILNIAHEIEPEPQEPCVVPKPSMAARLFALLRNLFSWFPA